MRNWRVLTAAAAVVLALVAAFAAYSYTKGADERAEDKGSTVSVLQASGAIPRGMKGQDAVASGLVSSSDVPKKLVPPGAVASFEALTDQVAVNDIAEGQFVVDGTFAEAQQAVVAGGFSSTLDKDKFAMQVQIDQTRAMGGFVVPGDRVNMIVTLNMNMGPDGVGGGALTTAYMLPGMKVLAVGETTAQVAAENGAEGGPAVTANVGLLTIEVDARQALQIAHAQSGGATSFYLTLTPPKFDPDKFEIPDEIVEQTNLFDQELEHWKEVAGQ